MPDPVWVLVAIAWIIEALVLGYVMGRRGYEAYSWTLMAAVLGPLILPVAINYVLRPPSREPKLLRAGHRAGGGVDVLVGVDGSPEAAAAVTRAASLFGPTMGRFTLARVVRVDATTEAEQTAEAELDAACAAHPELDPSTVVLRGEPIAALLEYLHRLGYEVLVVGTRGTGRSKAVLGSVATGLARGAGISVLLVDEEPAAAPTARPLREAV